MSHRATGPFDVKLAPQPTEASSEGAVLGRMSLNKQYHGDLEATAKGEMLSIMGSEKGSGVYVAMEWITGALRGKSGSFALHHTGIMVRGVPSLSINVVPDSGTGELAGITGTLNIIIEAGKHSYEFDYSLEPTP